MTLPLPIRFHYADIKKRFRDLKPVKEVVAQIFADYKVALDHIDYIFTSDEFLLNINQTHLDHDTLTDIVTFPMHDNGDAVIGEVYISVDRVIDNAKTFGVNQRSELARVIFHGALHLCGLGDKSAKEQKLMRLQEEHYLELL